MLLVVFSYHAHYHITQLAVRHAIKHIPNIDRIAIIWDDLHDSKVSIPLHLTLPFHPMLIPWSFIDNIIVQNTPGWFNQQIIKLHLDQILEDSEFIILDGDTILNQDVDPVNNFYATQIPKYHQSYKHLDKILGLYYGDFTSCPFMYVKSVWLKNIRLMCEVNANSTIQKEIIENSRSVKEWELISKYVLDILREPKRVLPFYYKMPNTEHFPKVFNHTENFVLAGNDLFPIEFWKQHNVIVDKGLYNANML